MKTADIKVASSRPLGKRLYDQRHLLILSVPFVIWLIVFAYVPLVGWLMAFQNYKPNLGFFGSEWKGLYQFKRMFTDPILAPKFLQVLGNTLGMSVWGLACGFTIPIVFAILLNEVSNSKYKKFIQTVSYLPHFVSWVIVANIVTSLLSPTGPVNEFLVGSGLLGEPYYFFAKREIFWQLVTFADVWKETGWNAIIYIAAMTAIDPQLYEAAWVDGANRFQRIWHVTLPGIRSTIITLGIMSIGNIINIGFEKQWQLSNPIVNDVSLVLDKYIIDYGISNYNFSYGTALGMFKSVISITLIFLANRAAKKFGENIM
jgi:putative aldouronate transport system permease protein